MLKIVRHYINIVKQKWDAVIQYSNARLFYRAQSVQQTEMSTQVNHMHVMDPLINSTHSRLIYSRLLVIWYLNQFRFFFFNYLCNIFFHNFSRNFNAVVTFVRFLTPYTFFFFKWLIFQIILGTTTEREKNWITRK